MGRRRGGRATQRHPSASTLSGRDFSNPLEVNASLNVATRACARGLGRPPSIAEDSGTTTTPAVLRGTAERTFSSVGRKAEREAPSSYITANGASSKFVCPGCGSTGTEERVRTRGWTNVETADELEEGRNGRASSGDKVQGAKGKGRSSSPDKVEEATPPEESSSAGKRREERLKKRESNVDEGPEERRHEDQTSSSEPVVIVDNNETVRYHSEMLERVSPSPSTSSIIPTTTATPAIAI